MRPHPDEYSPYHEQYISLVETDDIVSELAAQGDQTAALLSKLGEEMGDHRYAPGKWTIKQVLGHVIDGERILAYRALAIARGETAPLPGYEQDDYVRFGQFEHRTLRSLIEEFQAVRRATILLLAGLTPEAWSRRGIANKNEVSVRAVAWIIAGHELHHRQGLLRDYLQAASGASRQA